QGARQVRSSAPDALQVFLSPPSWEVLVDRLRGRATEAPADIARRLETARVELAAEGEFDVSVVNDSVPLAAEEIVGLLTG
ncbi:MAG: guanylate kinase, partial [Actinomycetota bacterium]